MLMERDLPQQLPEPKSLKTEPLPPGIDPENVHGLACYYFNARNYDLALYFISGLASKGDAVGLLLYSFYLAKGIDSQQARLCIEAVTVRLRRGSTEILAYDKSILGTIYNEIYYCLYNNHEFEVQFYLQCLELAIFYCMSGDKMVFSLLKHWSQNNLEFDISAKLIESYYSIRLDERDEVGNRGLFMSAYSFLFTTTKFNYDRAIAEYSMLLLLLLSLQDSEANNFKVELWNQAFANAERQAGGPNSPFQITYHNIFMYFGTD
jgi:hypothetical protein